MIGQIFDEVKALPRPHPFLAAFFLGFLAILLYSYVPVYKEFWQPRWDDENGYYSYAYLVPVLSLVIVWMRREKILPLMAQPSAWGIPVLMLAIALRLMGHWQWTHWISSMGFPLFFLGASLILLGKPITRHLLYPILFLYLIVPMPSAVFDEITNPIQVWSTDVALTMLSPFYRIMKDSDVTFWMPGGYRLAVGVECSGFKVTIAMLTLLLFFFTIVNFPLWKKLLLPLALFPIVVISNGLRIALIAVFGHHYGPEAGDIAHNGWKVNMPLFGETDIPTTGALEILIPLVSLLLIARWLGWRR